MKFRKESDREKIIIDIAEIVNAYINNMEISENIARDIVNEYGLESN